MRIALVVIIGCFAAGCRSTQQDGASASGAGSTSYTQGTPDTMRADTTVGGRTPTPQQQGGGVRFTVDLTTYSPGATVAMRLRNQTRDTLGFNQCSSRVVERQEGTSWIPHPEPGRMCTMQLQLLMPNDTTTATTDLPQDLRPGTHRITLTFSRQSATRPGTIRAISPSFRVN